MMATTPNFLLGYGERLTQPISHRPGGARQTPPYSVSESVDRLMPMIRAAVRELDELPDAACPRGEAVAVVTLHPQYIAKSYDPSALLRAVGLETVGSRPVKIKPEKLKPVKSTPEKPKKERRPEISESTDLFVAGPRERFREWAARLPEWRDRTPGAADLFKVEQFRAAKVQDRLRPIGGEEDEPLLEVVLHADETSDYILDAFEAYLARFDMRPDLDRRLYAGRLCFMPLRAHRRDLQDIAKFSFLRVARRMPKLRRLSPIVRSWPGRKQFAYDLPDSGPLDPDLRVAVFDGGVPGTPDLDRWVERRGVPGVGPSVDEFVDHGLGVSSALLFGSLRDGERAEVPFGMVDHFRVLDESSGKDEDLYDVLPRIRDVLQSRVYEFANLSIGPELPIEDDDVHAWTSVLDEQLSSGDVLTTIAVGNGGERDEALGFNRVQVPADCVNALAVGASDSLGQEWTRAGYSSVGPGRSPGMIKPDIMAFGGSESEPFWVMDSSKPGQSMPLCGTSFASPAALRMGLGIRAHFGRRLRPLALKALLVHCSEEAGHDRRQIGWGRIPNSVEDFVICSDGAARVVYQGELTSAQYLRAQIPIPAEQMQGYVTIRATFCYATQTDPQDPGNYTRSGLDVVFRPHEDRIDSKTGQVKTDSFFQIKDYSTETELRHDAHKWETTLHREKRKLGRSLKNPVFDIHYNARMEGGPFRSTNKIRYALVITVESLQTKDIYDRIVRRYRTLIQPLLPVIQIPIRS